MKHATRSRPRPITIADVAREAGVSAATVSRVLNGTTNVSASAREAVETAVQRTGYRANPHARSLVTGRSNSVAVLVTEPQERFFTDPTFAVLLRHLAKDLGAKDLALALIFAANEHERSHAIRFIQGGRLDAVIYVSPHSDEPMAQMLRDCRIPVIVAGERIDETDTFFHVHVDERGGACQAVSHLLARGCTRIATITGPLSSPGGRERLAGFTEAMGDRLDRSLIVEGDYSAESAIQATHTLLNAPIIPDGIFAASDVMAEAAIDVLTQRGLRIGEDIAVIGFDNRAAWTHTDTVLTTIHHPLHEVSHHISLLVERAINGEEPTSITIPTKLVVRQSA